MTRSARMYRTWASALALLACGCDDGGAANGAMPVTATGMPATGGMIAPSSGGGGAGAGSGSAAGGAGGQTGAAGTAGTGVGSGGSGGGSGTPAAGGEGAMGGAGGDAVDAGGLDASGMDEPAAGPTLPPVMSTTGDGPFAAMQDLGSGPQGRSGVFRPSELGKDGLQHPVFVWGCGGGSTPMTYAELLTKVATHGFIVVAEVAQIGDDGAPLVAAIDWIIAENERSGSPFYQHVDTKKIALGGHSIGSANSFYVADDPRLTTTIHVAGGSLDDVNNPFAETTGMGGKRLVHPVAYVCSMSDSFGNVEKTEKDYANTTVPAWMTVMTGVDHVGAARSGLPAIIAWLRWHVAGETDRRAAFLDAGGEFTTGIFVSKSKNW